jgi:hypothetical protein
MELCCVINIKILLLFQELPGWLESLALETRSYGAGGARRGGGKGRAFASRDYRMEGRGGGGGHDQVLFRNHCSVFKSYCCRPLKKQC